MFDPRIALLGVLADTLGSAAYIRDIVRGTTVPNRATFFLWSLAPLVAGAAALTEGAGWAAIPTITAGVLPAVILAASFTSASSVWRLGMFDYVCALLSVLALVLWWLSGRGDVAIVLSMAGDFMAALPTLRKCVTHPYTETTSAYAAAGIAGVCGALAARHVTFSELGFNIYLVVMCTILTTLILVQRRRLGAQGEAGEVGKERFGRLPPEIGEGDRV